MLALLLAGCAGERAPQRQAFLFDGPTMGTTYHVKVVGTELSDPRRKAIEAVIRGELDDVNAKMSTYIEDSELMRFNRYESTEPFELSDGTAAVFETALDVYERTGGAFDVTVGPLVNAWGFGPGSEVPEHDAPAMSDEEWTAVVERIGSDKLTLADGTIRKSRPDVFCDLSAIAKGYGVDRVAEKLIEMGERDFMAEVGGEVRTSGKNADGETWRIGIERPQMQQAALNGTQVHKIVPLDGRSLATSGDYRNYREVDGKRVAHIMDARVRRPIEHRLASVSVVDTTCVLADAYATALFVLGPEEGLEWAENEGLAALFLVRTDDGFEEIVTSAFTTLLESSTPGEKDS